MTDDARETWRGQLTAVGAVGAAIVVRAVLFHALGDKSPFITFYPAIMLAALYGGMYSGLLAAALSAIASLHWLEHAHGAHLPQGDDLPRFLLFLAVALTMVYLGHRAHRARHDVAALLDARDRAEDRIAQMLDSLNQAFVLVDSEWRFLYVNHACELMYNTSRDKLVGETLWKWVPHILGTQTEENYRRAMEQKLPVEFEGLSPRLGYWVATGAYPVAGGIAIYVQNIDARKRAEQALRDSEQRYRQLVETAQEGVWVIDAESKTTYVNQAMAEMLGYTVDQMVGRPMFDFTDEAARKEAEANIEKRKTGLSERHEFRFKRKDGSDFFAQVSTNPILGSNGEYRGALAMISDITERRIAERERAEMLVREQKARAEAEAANRRKDQFLAVLSHELRTPLTPVLARLSLMIREPGLSGSVKSGLEMIRRNVQLEARLIDDMLDMTRLARGQLKLQVETVDAHTKILAALEIYEAEVAAQKHTISLELDAREHFVRADPVRLQQIFWNLIGNAVKYTPPGGRIIIRSTNELGPEKLLVRVMDNGIGIAPDLMPRLFDPFEQGEQTLTRRFGGLGLGLSISRTLARMHGGLLTAESPGTGMGSTFTVELSTTAAVNAERGEAVPEPQNIQPVAPPSMPRSLPRILLVDDNEDTLRVMARMLRHNGHQVTTAGSVGSALIASAAPFDLLITDIGLPDGTGWELMKTLRGRGKVLGIALSGFSMEEDIQRSRDVGFLEHLCKPIMPEDLEKAIERAGREKTVHELHE